MNPAFFLEKGIISAEFGASVETRRCDNRTAVKVRVVSGGMSGSSVEFKWQHKAVGRPVTFQFLCYVDIACGTLFILNIILFF